MSSLLIRGGTILTMNDRLDVLTGDIVVRDGRLVSVGGQAEGPYDRTIDAGGSLVLPGFVQTHVHLCQTLFRGFADDLPLMEWLRQRVWPMEAAHTPSSLRAAALLASYELLSTGTTTVLTMETVHDTDAVFEAVAEVGLRAVIGKCLMDADAQAPKRLFEPTRRAIDESLSLQKRWHGACNGRLRAAFAPRFALSCSRELLEAVGSLSRAQHTIVHTHASEQQAEIALVERATGRRNLQYFADTGLVSPHLCVAH
ncbi:MAG: amidohydrolase family protein, partial [Vicinamibacterales bacterium]|nr:amidohydrolase family protein [Vicinamibacterales bacterium]